MKTLLMLSVLLSSFTPYQYRLTPVNDLATCMDLNARESCDTTQGNNFYSCGNKATDTFETVFYLYPDKYTDRTGNWYVLRLDTNYYDLKGRYFVKTEVVWSNGFFIPKDLMYLAEDGNDLTGNVIGVIDYLGKGWLSNGQCVELFPRFECYR